ncbi:hypothetical protein BRPE64_ACDS17930 [Caballeronia insecticola]|uniref:Uncharacterized protein n=1 Tax=Caballeronia insecticola TaxID=758793 RepID=R4WYY9_9BURK|nr:hypothetical protein BRPE64_ACDS17930 [Caballeronia insecticola]
MGVERSLDSKAWFVLTWFVLKLDAGVDAREPGIAGMLGIPD